VGCCFQKSIVSYTVKKHKKNLPVYGQEGTFAN